MSVMTVARDRIKGLVSESIYDNPVVTREFRTRMRGWKAFMVMGGYALLLAGIMFTVYVSLWNSHVGPGGNLPLTDRKVGMELFLWLAWTQSILLSLIIPSLTFSSITQELERKTIELLSLTRLTPGKIVLGKQLAGFLYALVLLICSVPLAGMCLMFGGISPGEIALWYMVLTAWCFLLTCAGVFWSSLFAKTAPAALFTYGTALGYFLFVTFPFGMMTSAPYISSGHPHVFGALNPGWAAYASAAVAKVCGLKVPLAVAALVLHGAIGTLLLLVASTHVRYQRAERAPSIRLTLMIVTAMLIWFLVGNLTALGGFGGGPSNVQELISLVAGILLGFVMLMTCAIATGHVNVAPGRSVFAYALSFRKIFRSDLGGAIGFAVLWVVVSYAVFGATTYWVSVANHAKIGSRDWAAYWHVGVALAAITAATAAIGVLASCIVRQRKNAAALVILFIIIAFAGYGIVLAYHTPGLKTQAPVWQLAAFWPMTPILASTKQWQGMPNLWWQPKDSWIVCSVAYLALASLALGLATRPLKKLGGVRED